MNNNLWGGVKDKKDRERGGNKFILTSTPHDVTDTVPLVTLTPLHLSPLTVNQFFCSPSQKTQPYRWIRIVLINSLCRISFFLGRAVNGKVRAIPLLVWEVLEAHWFSYIQILGCSMYSSRCPGCISPRFPDTETYKILTSLLLFTVGCAQFQWQNPCLKFTTSNEIPFFNPLV